MKLEELNRTYKISFIPQAEVTLDETICIIKRIFQCSMDETKLPFTAKVVFSQDPYRLTDVDIESINRNYIIIKVKSSHVIPMSQDFLKDEISKLERKLFQLRELKRNLKILNHASKNTLKELDIKQL